MCAVEIEIRSMISERKYEELAIFLKKMGKFIREDEQITYYFSGDHDLRVQQNSRGAKLWLKSGNLHDEMREEIEVEFKREDFSNLVRILQMLGYSIDVKFFRKRAVFELNGAKVSLDYTPGFGYVVEVEGSSSSSKLMHKNVSKKLTGILHSLGIKPTPKKNFERRFRWYRRNWKSVLKLNGIEI
jgi:predicted adenylyl cyclase CyaB